jgi:hypothetical protein
MDLLLTLHLKGLEAGWGAAETTKKLPPPGRLAGVLPPDNDYATHRIQKSIPY